MAEMGERQYSWLVIATFTIGLLALIFGFKLFAPEQRTVGPLDVSVTDVGYHTLPYVRVEIENLEKGYKSEAQNSGRFFDGSFYEGEHRVVVKLGKHSSEMDTVVYDKVHNFTKDTKTLGITLNNVRQRFDVEVADQNTEILVVPYVEWNSTVLQAYSEGRYSRRTDLTAPTKVELKVLDDIESSFNTNLDNLFRDFSHVTFIRQEVQFTKDYPEGMWIYHVIFTESEPSYNWVTPHQLAWPVPNVSFTVSQGMPEMNKLSHSLPSLSVSGITIVKTTFETKDFISKLVR